MAVSDEKQTNWSQKRHSLNQYIKHIVLVLADHVIQACIGWLSADHIYLYENDTYHGIPI